MKDHVIRQVVNDLRDAAIKFHDTQQLRERLRSAVEPLITATAQTVAESIHYPACWDMAAYPTLEDAIYAIGAFKCSECPVQPVAVPDGAALVNAMAKAGQVNDHGRRMLLNGEEIGFDLPSLMTIISLAAPAAQGDARDAERYRWLRDKSEPAICAFYLSVGKAFDGVKFTQARVNEAIDAQIANFSSKEAK